MKVILCTNRRVTKWIARSVCSVSGLAVVLWVFLVFPLIIYNNYGGLLGTIHKNVATELPIKPAIINETTRTVSTEKPIQREKERNRIVYIRIPKTGSSTVTLLVWRYAWTRNLSVLAVNPNFEGTRARLLSRYFFLPPRGVKCDVMAEHVLYDHIDYMRFFHEDTVFTTMLREPMSLLVSTLYYVPGFKQAIPGDNKLTGYLSNPTRYDMISPMAGRSYTRNPQASYLGLKKEDFNNMERVKELISFISSKFSLVMILEKMDESLLLLRRVTKWPMKDIIYAVQNVNSQKPKLPVSPAEREQYKTISLADHQIYEFFSRRLNAAIKEAGESFQEELKLFRKYKTDIAQYCRFKLITDEILTFPRNEFHELFQVTRKDCSLINVEPLALISSIRKRQGSFPYISPLLNGQL